MLLDAVIAEPAAQQKTHARIEDVLQVQSSTCNTITNVLYEFRQTGLIGHSGRYAFGITVHDGLP